MKGYLELCKPKITLLIVLTTLGGFLLAVKGQIEWIRVIWTLVGVGLFAAATGCLNQLMEIEQDSLMFRTKGRPLPEGRVQPKQAFIFGLMCAVFGGSILLWRVNLISCIFATLTLLTYLFIYTPLKQKTPFSTWIGALPGAMPPLIGWVAANGTLDTKALVIYGIQFFWQLPHFLSLAWLYREDYARAGFRTISVTDPSGFSTVLQITVSSALLLLVSFIPHYLGMAQKGYIICAGIAGLIFLSFGFKLMHSISSRDMRLVFLVSMLYLPIIFTFLVLNRA